MEVLEKLESELESIYRALFDAEDPLDMLSFLSENETQEYEKKAARLEREINNIYGGMIKVLEEKYPEINNDEIKKLYDKNNKNNYLILKYLISHPNICSSSTILNEIEHYIYDSKNKFSRDTSNSNIFDRITKLNNLQPTFFQHETFVKFLNNWHFDYLHHYFENATIMNNPKFVDYLLDIVKNNKLHYDEYHSVTPLMESALKENLDFDFVYALGNKDEFKKYLSRHSKDEMLDLASSIEDEELKKKIIIDIFGIIDTSKVSILIKFVEIPEIKLQLLDENSFYYNFLIEPLLNERYIEDNRDQDEMKEIDYNKGYASIDSILESEDFGDFNFKKMIHHFDKIVGNYIYFFFDNEVKRVPILSYIKTLRKKIDLWDKITSLPNYAEISDEVSEIIEDLLFTHIDINKSFEELAAEALEENIDTSLSPEDENYWTYLLNEANHYLEPVEDESILLKL